jgi:hypothetical protein
LLLFPFESHFVFGSPGKSSSKKQSDQEYRDAGERYYEERYQDHLVRRLQKQAAAFGFQLMPNQPNIAPVS